MCLYNTASNDATIKGATIKGATLRGDDTVNLKVGNDLSLESVKMGVRYWE